MPVNSVAENVLGTLGTVCWTVQMVPQIWKSWRTQSTEGLSHWLVLVWGISAAFLGAYTIILDLNIPLIVQPQLFGFLALVSWGQCQYYGKPHQPSSRRRATLLAILAMLLVGAFEAMLVFSVQPSYQRGTQAGRRGVQFMGIMSSVLISLALIPQYGEIYRMREVVGISITFMVVDALGGIFSDLSLVFRDHFDVIAGTTYSLVVILDGLVILAALILNPQAAKRRRRLSETPGVRDIEERAVTASLTSATSQRLPPSPSVDEEEEHGPRDLQVPLPPGLSPYPSSNNIDPEMPPKTPVGEGEDRPGEMEKNEKVESEKASRPTERN
ncbi:PQ loop repeat-domain-containing protein [Mycena amicta]|nr:PQ loop repeat-domain-containing protein [Mycena amicta]